MPHLLSPLEFAGLRLRNRLVLPPLWLGRAGADGLVTEAHLAHYHQRAEAGCGLVIVEHCFVHPRGRHSATQLSAAGDQAVEGLARLAGAIHDGGAVACLQLAHAGSKGSAAVLGAPPVGPSAVRHPCLPEGEVPEALDRAGLEEVVQAFGQAAERARAAGFDAVEVHAAHGFLLSQFLSPLTNLRRDAWGGDLEGRSRLHREVLAEVRRTLGRGTALFIRLGADDETPGGVTIAESCRVAPWLVQAGADLIDVSGGLQGSRPEGRGPGYFVPFAAAIRQVVSVPVLVTGGITEAGLADAIVRDGQADLVGVGRPQLANPQWAREALHSLRG
jgi:2,4-dienoyl-CoA reductase-like NADH-dependent reductase (Old Yellow Enzyme family)